jgi:formylglycine-generating enzyme required for sulfatase activity
MLGNLWEWCLDGGDARQAHEELWTGNTNARVLRGGSFYDTPGRYRCATRIYHDPARSDSHLGFRVVVGVDMSGARRGAAGASAAVAPSEGGILAPAETRVSALTTNPKVGEVFTLPLGSNVTMELMGIPPGEFMMGSSKEEQAWAVANGLTEQDVKREGEAPQNVAIKQGFWIGRTEVTVGQWKQFVKETNHVTDAEKRGGADVYQGPEKSYARMKGKSWRDPNFGFELQDCHPVSCVSWTDAVAFCKWLTEHQQKAGLLPTGWIVRLPTEAEWEYACRAGTQTKFWWGDSEEDGKGRLNWLGKEDGYEFVAPVDSYDARGRNRFGLADMLGNVYEWCLDEYDRTQARGDSSTGNATVRVLRGGSFDFGHAACRCANFFSTRPSHSISLFGFRVCVGPTR